MASADPAERRPVDRFGVQTLAHLGQLLGIAEQQQVARCDGGCRRGCQRELPGLIDDDYLVTDDKTRDFLNGWVGKFTKWVGRFAVPQQLEIAAE